MHYLHLLYKECFYAENNDKFILRCYALLTNVYVVVQLHPWFDFYFPLFFFVYVDI